MKNCFICNIEKPLSEFYSHPQTADKKLNKCKSCSKEYGKNSYNNKKNDPLYISTERKRSRDKYHRLYSGAGKHNYESNRKWREKYPEKAFAYSVCKNLPKPFENAEKHHWSYNECDSMDVIWMIKKNHSKSHRFIVYDQERMMYRRYDNNVLLDTKEDHYAFILYCIENMED